MLPLRALLLEPHLGVPHQRVQHLSELRFDLLRKAGARGLIFDKDNTLTAPFIDEIHPAAREPLRRAEQVFGRDKIVVVSNSVGCRKDPPPHAQAKECERRTGLRIVRYGGTKPTAGAKEALAALGCAAHEVVVIGDRVLTDVVFGNKNGFFTVHTGFLEPTGEGIVVPQLRRLEDAFLELCKRRGIKAPQHPIERPK
eukprot:tig00000444_g816.t1